MAGIDKPHDYRDGVHIQIPSEHSSSDGPAPAGSKHETPESNTIPDASSFMDAHGQARSGDPYKPTTPGRLGQGVYSSGTTHDYEPGMPASVSNARVMDGCAGAYSWSDATGGMLGHHPDGYEDSKS